MKPTIKDDCTHAYAAIAVLVAVFMVLFVASTHGQELPNAPRAAVKHQIPPVHKQRLLLAKPGNPDLGSADWFRELGYFRLANFIPVLTRTDWGLSYDKPKETGHGSHKGR